jgi:hypothetical protein
MSAAIHSEACKLRGEQAFKLDFWVNIHTEHQVLMSIIV